MANRLPYKDADWFAVPLREGRGFGAGVVARHDGRGGVIGYFFGVRFDEVPSIADIEGLRPSEALRVMRFGDLRLIKRTGPSSGRLGIGVLTSANPGLRTEAQGGSPRDCNYFRPGTAKFSTEFSTGSALLRVINRDGRCWGQRGEKV